MGVHEFFQPLRRWRSRGNEMNRRPESKGFMDVSLGFRE